MPERSSRPAAVELELFTSRFTAIAAEMGEMLRRTALSTNVKERLDFSCAVLDARGRLVVNAPHIPVHLGSLGLCVRTVRDVLPLGPGDVAITNHPGFGGSHLPDVTLIAAVHDEDGSPLGFVANRAHHAEIGGTRPGSMPPAARCLAEEGVVIEPTLIVAGGTPRWDEIERRLSSAPWPTRALSENLADLTAQLASCRHGATALAALAQRHGAMTVRRFMEELDRLAAVRGRDAVRRLPPGVRHRTEALDDRTPLAVTITVADGRATFDFTGSGPVHSGNLNATPAIVRSVVLYVMRLLLDAPLPLNEGLLEPLDLIIPEGLLAPPFDPDPRRAPAVVGGNVETSQRLVDLLLGALDLAACSQGTMNNVLFGTASSSYYETVCGGEGASPGHDGASAVHTHMTNTRITDPELLELRYPVRLERFAVRRGSGGAGRWRGGDGAFRELVFLAPMELSVLTQHRTAGPFGMAGGDAGAPGRQRVVRADGREETLGPVDGRRVDPGDRLIVETPGGGGWGTPVEES